MSTNSIAISIEDVLDTFYGDANLDGEFNTSDLVQILQGGQYEDNVLRNSRWETGDFNGDLEFTTSDLVRALQTGAYERGPRAAVAAVPEPASLWMLLLTALPLLVRRQK